MSKEKKTILGHFSIELREGFNLDDVKSFGTTGPKGTSSNIGGLPDAHVDMDYEH